MKNFYFIFGSEGIILISDGKGGYTIPIAENFPEELIAERDVMHAGNLDGLEVYCYRTKIKPNDSTVFSEYPLRQSYNVLDHKLYLMAGKCAELLYFNDNTMFCGRCGGQMEKSTDISKRCVKCGNEVWPQLSTAVIVLIRKGDEALLVHSKNFKRKYYGLVAGFVETGETLEEAVKREAMEETGLTINNLQYFGSQPWPYPCGLMIGFTADYESGEIKIQEEELAEASWFRKDSLPPIPEKLSIARQLIDNWRGEL